MNYLKQALTFFAVLTLTLSAKAEVKPISLSGAFSANGSLYGSDRQSDRQDPSTYRAAFTPTLTIYDQITLPFELYLANNTRGFHQPFNQFGANPRIGPWLTLHGGYFTTQLTDLSFGDTRLLGGGVDLHPSWFRLVALYGRSQKAQQADTTVGLHGLFDRYVAAGMLGIGKTDKNFFNLTVMRAVDDTGSLLDPAPLTTPDSNSGKYYYMPKENLVASLSWGLQLIENRLSFRGEMAGSAYSSSMTDSIVRSKSLPSWLSSYFTPRYSSQFDAAVKTQIMWTMNKTFQLGLNGRWVGPGYLTLGYSGMPSDLFDVTLAPTLRLAKSRYLIRPSFGIRFNNIYGTRIATTTRTIGSLTATAQPTNALGVEVQYSNYGTRSNSRSDTLRVSNIAQSLTLTPHYTFTQWGATQTTSCTYSRQGFTDQNVVTAALDKYSVNSLNALWSQIWPSTLSATSSLTFVNSATTVLNTSIYGLNETFSHSFLADNALSASINAGYNLVHTVKTDGQLTAGTTVSYKAGKAGIFSLTLSSNRYDYGAAGSVPSFQEFQGALQYTLSF